MAGLLPALLASPEAPRAEDVAWAVRVLCSNEPSVEAADAAARRGAPGGASGAGALATAFQEHLAACQQALGQAAGCGASLRSGGASRSAGGSGQVPVGGARPRRSGQEVP
jgi:hypothetical protein